MRNTHFVTTQANVDFGIPSLQNGSMTILRLGIIAISTLALVASVRADVFNMPAGQTSLQLVSVGNPGNANDPNTGSLYGGVAYSYSIGKYEVTVGQYTAFLNAVAATDTYGLYNPNMATDLNVAGIARNDASGSYTYSVIGSPNHPISYVSWGDAARFTNWLNNSQPTGAEGAGTTETGAYTLNGAVTDTALNAVARNANAVWVIPSENEWYKAAYYDPSVGHYWQYPTGTDAIPTSTAPPGSPNSANFYGVGTGYAVTGSQSYSSSQNYLTDVGAYSASPSPYGTFDQGGNVSEWDEALIGTGGGGTRGGEFNDESGPLNSSSRLFTLISRSTELNSIGFRVAAVPEPCTLVLGVLAALMVGGSRLRF
jgi:formylglycine-generating enzyme required for sulfatase activity